MTRSRSIGIGICANTWIEIIIRILFLIAWFKLEEILPFERKIHKEERWLYSNPRTDSYVPSWMLWPIVCVIPSLVFIVYFLITRNKLEFLQAIFAISLAIGLNGIITDLLKLSVGRPRPDFMERCFPDGVYNDAMICTGEAKDIIEGRKSFPSGHSSFSFTSLFFVSLYMMGKLHVLGDRGRGKAWPLLVCTPPVFTALLVAVSRTCDYHHHWQDVLVGSIIGILLSYVSYRLYYPPLASMVSHRSYAELALWNINESIKDKDAAKVSTELRTETESFLTDDKETKWI